MPRFASACLLVALCLSGCANVGDKVKERRAYWQERVDTEIPVPSSRERIEGWARAQGIVLAPPTLVPLPPALGSEAGLQAQLETIDTSGGWFTVCSHWTIQLRVTMMSVADVSSGNEISMVGTCL